MYILTRVVKIYWKMKICWMDIKLCKNGYTGGLFNYLIWWDFNLRNFKHLARFKGKSYPRRQHSPWGDMNTKIYAFSVNTWQNTVRILQNSKFVYQWSLPIQVFHKECGWGVMYRRRYNLTFTSPKSNTTQHGSWIIKTETIKFIAQLKIS